MFKALDKILNKASQVKKGSGADLVQEPTIADGLLNSAAYQTAPHLSSKATGLQTTANFDEHHRIIAGHSIFNNNR